MSRHQWSLLKHSLKHQHILNLKTKTIYKNDSNFKIVSLFCGVSSFFRWQHWHVPLAHARAARRRRRRSTRQRRSERISRSRRFGTDAGGGGTGGGRGTRRWLRARQSNVERLLNAPRRCITNKVMCVCVCVFFMLFEFSEMIRNFTRLQNYFLVNCLAAVQ